MYTISTERTSDLLIYMHNKTTHGSPVIRVKSGNMNFAERVIITMCGNAVGVAEIARHKNTRNGNFPSCHKMQ